MSSGESSSEYEFELPLNISDDKYYTYTDKPQKSLQPQQSPQPLSDTFPEQVNQTKKSHSLGEHLFKLKQFPPKDVDLQIPKYGQASIQHSLPAYDLWRPFFPTYLSDEGFRNLHRPKLRHFKVGPQALTRSRKSIKFPVKNVARLIYKNQKKLRYQVIHAINQGMTREEIVKNLLLIRHAKDLTAKSGEHFFFEYMEEFPPVLNQIGMASNIKNYFIPNSAPTTRKVESRPPTQPTSDLHSQKLASNQTTATQQNNSVPEQDNTNSLNHLEPNSTPNISVNYQGNYKVGYEQPFNQNRLKNGQLYYCQFNPGSKLKVIENNMYRAPIFEQREPMTDFLVIRTRNSFYIRLIKNLFVVGQTFPLVAIPTPTDGVILNFRSRFSNAYAHKIFRQSKTNPPSLDLNQFHKLFPDYCRTALRERLKKNGAIYIKDDETFIRGQSKYGLMPLQELRRFFTPEQYCLNMSMLAARERLKKLSYTDTMILPATKDAELETEVLCAPWNTSQALMGAVSGKNYLDLKKHLADPTGPSNAGFSCVSWSRSPTEEQQMKEQIGAKSVLSAAQNDLSSIPFVNILAPKIKREKLERLAIYQRAAREIAELQARTLSQLDSDSSYEESDYEAEDEENEMDESFEREFQKLNVLVEEGKTLEEFNHEQEEAEREQMIRQFRLDTSTPRIPTKSIVSDNSVSQFKNKILKIIRSYDTVEENRIERTEIVRDPKIISLYVRKKKAEESQNSSQRLNENFSKLRSSCSQPSDVGSQRRASLGASELCRADGIVLTISKQVLNTRAMRKRRRELMDMSI